MSEIKIISRVDRLARFVELRPNEAIELIALGEPVSIALLKAVNKKNKQIIDQIFQVDFDINCSYDPYSVYGPTCEDDTIAIYNFMQSYYGKYYLNVILNRVALWENFLVCATASLFKSGKLTERLKELLEAKDYDKASQFVGFCNSGYYKKLQYSIPVELLLEFFEYATEHNCAIAKSFFDVRYLANQNLLTESVVKAYLASYPTLQKGVKNLLRKKGGLEALKQLNDAAIVGILYSLGKK